MSNLADRIEEYLKMILQQTDEGYIVLQRGFLADFFSCAPSQINYVLTTRFSAERGYLVESRRGGGGYLRIVRLGLDPEGKLSLLERNYLKKGLIIFWQDWKKKKYLQRERLSLLKVFLRASY